MSKSHYPIDLYKKSKLTIKQKKAIYDVLRTLDIYNDYDLGDQLRRAFKLETHGLRGRPPILTRLQS